MAAEQRATPEYRVPLTRERVLDGAVAFADEHGVEAITMRKLAAALGFEVMSLYNHVANKDDMLDGMIELVAEEIESIDPAAGWRAGIRANAVSAHDAMLRHPWSAALWSTRMPGPARVRFMEGLLRTLREGGFDPEAAYLAYHAVTLHLQGFTVEQLGFRAIEDELSERAQEFMAGLDESEFPYLIEHVRQHFDGTERHDEFELVLDMLLDGLEELRTA